MSYSVKKDIIKVLVILFMLSIAKYAGLYFTGYYTVGRIIEKDDGLARIIYVYDIDGYTYRGSALYRNSFNEGDYHMVIYSSVWHSTSQLINERRLESPNSLDSLKGKKADGSLIDFWDM